MHNIHNQLKLYKNIELEWFLIDYYNRSMN